MQTKNWNSKEYTLKSKLVNEVDHDKHAQKCHDIWTEQLMLQKRKC